MDDSESKDLTKPGSKSLSRAEKRMWEVARFFEGLSFQAAAGHTGSVNKVCFSPDGSLAASASGDGTVKIWEAVSGRQLHSLKHGDWVNSVCFSPDGTQVASGSGNGSVVIWEASGGRELHRLKHGGWVSSVCFSPDGSQVASSSSDGTIKIWDSKAGRLLATLLTAGRNDWITYTSDGYFISSEGIEKRVMMKWEHSGNQYPPDIFPRDNPNPQKVAEALASTRSRKPKPKTSPRRPKGLSGKRQRQLEPPK